jgi:hypothetical protein
VHQLKERGHQSRVDYRTRCQNFLVEEGEEIVDVTFFTDEARFHLSEYVNSQNTRLRSSKNPHEFKEMALHDQKVRMWCAISPMRIIGPIFLNDSTNAERYSTDILEPFLGHLTEREIEKAWFQQDGATAHTASSSLQFLEDIFGNRVISRGIWPARSPVLTPTACYLWDALKGKVYANSPHTVDELKAAITIHIQQIPPATLLKVVDNMKQRVQTCLQARGGHFQHLL